VRSARTAAVYWDGESWAPAWVIAWYHEYGSWFVMLRTRRDVWRDQETWYSYDPGALLPVSVDARDLQEWQSRRPLD